MYQNSLFSQKFNIQFYSHKLIFHSNKFFLIMLQIPWYTDEHCGFCSDCYLAHISQGALFEMSDTFQEFQEELEHIEGPGHKKFVAKLRQQVSIFL